MVQNSSKTKWGSAWWDFKHTLLLHMEWWPPPTVGILPVGQLLPDSQSGNWTVLGCKWRCKQIDMLWWNGHRVEPFLKCVPELRTPCYILRTLEQVIYCMAMMAKFSKLVCVMYYLPDRRKPTPILTMEENTSNGVFNMLVGSGTGCNSVQQEMSSMVQRHVIQVKFFSCTL